ncbi:glycoside hydrolase family 43 protein [Aeoliella sp. ICT_H6.2]|uniref:Glycoside hydrolase family 43 protein n=1 Tax=Aeoliella straminimaris TaxID=2954799 RepID=A0A9X2JF65_9BACT|nr:glycoside hydrolase family 43 protein [Aeoliella straminimaris]MCO6043376.1 glycoside hydrolase family 43 protein [Aeoliella straminimaris]
MHRSMTYAVATAITATLLLAPLSAAKNPIDPGWYADPEVAVFGERYWIYPTTSAKYDEQVYFDAFSSPDLVNWKKHERILTADDITWARRAMWAPCCVENNGKYYLFFAANDLQRPGGPLYDKDNPNNHTGGIGVAVADRPEGPFKDLLGKPLIAEFHHNAQPIDQCVFQDDDGTWYLYYGGWGHCNVGRLKDDFTGIEPFDDGQLFHEITPRGYVEGPVMFKRDGKYYFMWSQGGWTNGTYHVAYAIADSPTGPFKRVGTVLESDENIATGAGHHSVLRSPASGDWYIVYHRRPIPNKDRDHRVTCVDRLEFNDDGTIKPVKMTFEGVKADALK